MPVLGMDLKREPENWSPEAEVDLMEFFGKRKSQERAHEEAVKAPAAVQQGAQVQPPHVPAPEAESAESALAEPWYWDSIEF